MKAKKFFSALFITLMLVVASACSGDDEDDGLYDWFITKSYYTRQGANATCYKRENEYLYDKSEEYVKIEKIKFESHSNEYNTYKYAYHKL